MLVIIKVVILNATVECHVLGQCDQTVDSLPENIYARFSFEWWEGEGALFFCNCARE